VIEELKTILSLPSKKDDPQLHGLLGQKLKETGKFKEAAAEFHTAWKLSPKNLYFLKQKGFCHYSLGEYEEAVNALSQVFRKNPNDYRVRSTLKRIYTTTNNLTGFIALLEDVLKDHPDNVKLIGILKGAVKEAGANSPENR
jgi:tetratricopeptide (TPR) repeat protein